MSSPMPQDPFSAMGQMAATLHEAYQTWITAGFTKPEALYLVGQVLQAIITGPTASAPD